MSTREDELKAVKERIEIFAVKLRGRDSGGDDGMHNFGLFRFWRGVLVSDLWFGMRRIIFA